MILKAAGSMTGGTCIQMSAPGIALAPLMMLCLDGRELRQVTKQSVTCLQKCLTSLSSPSIERARLFRSPEVVNVHDLAGYGYALQQLQQHFRQIRPS